MKLDIRCFIRNWKLEIRNLISISNIQPALPAGRYPIFFLLFIAAVSAVRGLLNGHATGTIFADTIPYLFFFYYFPLRRLWAEEKFRTLVKNAFIAAIGGNFLFILFSFAGFSSGFFTLQDAYYHWYRDVGLGKITELGLGSYRLVLNEHLLLVPILIFLLYLAIKKTNKYFNIFRQGRIPACHAMALAGRRLWWIIFSNIFVLSLNLTRAYLLALVVGILFLFRREYWKRWLAYSAGAALVFLLIFTSTHLIASRGQSLGWEFFGLRLNSIVRPQTEDSSLSRLLLLPPIWEKIKNKPLLGQGLGDTVAVYSPIFKKDIITPHFDWGYLEIWAEMGGLGLLAWLALVAYIIYALKKQPVDNGALWPTLISLLIINITSPALFHVLGVLLLVFTLTLNQYDRANA